MALASLLFTGLASRLSRCLVLPPQCLPFAPCFFTGDPALVTFGGTRFAQAVAPRLAGFASRMPGLIACVACRVPCGVSLVLHGFLAALFQFKRFPVFVMSLGAQGGTLFAVLGHFIKHIFEISGGLVLNPFKHADYEIFDRDRLIDQPVSGILVSGLVKSCGCSFRYQRRGVSGGARVA